MCTIEVKPDESIDSVLKRLKKAVDTNGILSDLRKHEFYEKPSVQKKKKRIAARKRAAKHQKKVERYQLKTNNHKNFKFNKDKTEKIYQPPPPKREDDRPQQQPKQKGT